MVRLFLQRISTALCFLQRPACPACLPQHIIYCMHNGLLQSALSLSNFRIVFDDLWGSGYREPVVDTQIQHPLTSFCTPIAARMHACGYIQFSVCISLSAAAAASASALPNVACQQSEWLICKFCIRKTFPCWKFTCILSFQVLFRSVLTLVFLLLCACT